MRSAARDFYRSLWKHKLETPELLEAEVELRETATLEWLGNGESLLDVGCGHGGLLKAARHRVPVTVGLDLEPLAAGQAQAACLGAVVGDVDDGGLPFRDQSFQIVTCLDVVEHVFDPISLLKEIHRVLRPGGWLLLSTPNIRYWRHLRGILLGRFPRTSIDEAGYDGGHIHYFTSADLFESMSQVGTWGLECRGIFGVKLFKHRLLATLLGRVFEREFLAPGILIKARKE